MFKGKGGHILLDMELHACRVSVDRQANVYMVVCICRQLVGVFDNSAWGVVF